MKFIDDIIGIYNGICYDKKFMRDITLIGIGMFYMTLFFSSFVMGYKAISYSGHIICSSVLIFPLLFPINDSISEVLDKRATYLMILITIICEYLFSSVTYLLASCPSPAHWEHQDIYNILTSGFLKISVADSISLSIGFVANTYVFNRWGLKVFGKGFFRRSLGATAIGELFFTISTNFLAFLVFGKASTEDTFSIIIFDYIFKMGYSVIICIPNAIFVGWIKSKMQINETSKSKNVVNISEARAFVELK